MIRTLGPSRISHKLQFARESVVRFGGLGPVGVGVAVTSYPNAEHRTARIAATGLPGSCRETAWCVNCMPLKILYEPGGAASSSPALAGTERAPAQPGSRGWDS